MSAGRKFARWLREGLQMRMMPQHRGVKVLQVRETSPRFCTSHLYYAAYFFFNVVDFCVEQICS